MKRVELYNSPEERQTLIDSAVMMGEYLIEEGNTVDGNYLVFSTTPVTSPPDILQDLEQEIREAENLEEIKDILIRRARDGTLIAERAFFVAAIL